MTVDGAGFSGGRAAGRSCASTISRGDRLTINWPSGVALLNSICHSPDYGAAGESLIPLELEFRRGIKDMLIIDIMASYCSSIIGFRPAFA
jgi:hypothetical protein